MIEKYKNLLLGLFLLLGFIQVGNAQSGFYSTVSAKKLVVGSSFEYSIVAENLKPIKAIYAPSFKNLKVLSGPMNSSSTTITNGRTNTKQERVYTLTATKPGIYKIGPASAIINNTKEYTQSITIEFVKDNNKNAGKLKGEKYFVKMIPSDSVVYIGQQLTINYVVYTQVSIQAANILQEPDYNGFYKEENTRYSRSNNIEEIDGIQYHTSIIKQVCLYPQQTGNYKIGEAIFKIGVQGKKPNNSRRSIFFRNNLDYENLITNELSIYVKDVPKPQPSDFIGGVGDFTMQAQLDRREVQNKKAFNLVVVYTGNGDPKMFTPKALNLGENFELYDPILQQEQVNEVNNSKVFSRKYQYTIVPKKEGNFNILAQASYYNPDSSRFMKLTKGPFPLKVLKGRAVEKIVDNTKNDTLASNWPIAELKTKSTLYNKTGMNSFLILSFFGILGMIGNKMYKNSTSDERNEKKRQLELHKRVMSRLKEAKSFLEQGNNRAFHDETVKALQKYLSEKFGLEIGSITPQKVQTLLIPNGVSENNIANIKLLLEESQIAIFGGIEKRTMEETFQMLTNVIEEIEK